MPPPTPTHAKPRRAAAAVPFLLPDVVLPGQRRVTNELVFEPSPELSQWQLVAAPVRGLGGIERVEPGRPFAFSGKYGTRLYALPAGAPLPDDARLEELAQYPSSPPPVAAVWSVAAVRPLAKVVTTCRFDGVREEGLELVVLGERHFDAAGREIDGWWLPAVLLGVCAVGVFALWRTARRQRVEPVAARLSRRSSAMPRRSA